MASRAAVAFQEELDRLVERFRMDWDLDYREAIGALELLKLDLYAELQDDVEDDE